MYSSDGSFGKWISIINRNAQSYFFHKLKPFGVGPGQQAYLLALQPEELIIQDELAKRLMVDRANVTRAVRALAGIGYINQQPSERDARVKVISLTSRGVEVRESIRQIAEEWIELLKKDINPYDWKKTEETLRLIALSFQAISFTV